jgi:hypothetical protein
LNIRISTLWDARREKRVVRSAVILALLTAGLSTAQTTDQGEQDEYQGPQILSRTASEAGERGGAPISFRPYGNVAYVYDSGLLADTVNSQGQLINPGAQQGIDAGFGVIGSRRWRFDQISLDYHGNYTHYSPDAFFNGTTQYLGLNYTHVFSPRWNITLRENGGVSPYSYGQLAYVPMITPGLNGVPTNELFDNRTIFSQSGVDFTYQRTRRLSFQFGGDGFLVRRRSTALAGLNGGDGHFDVAYRFSKKQTLTANFSYAYYGYQRAFGNANTETLNLGYAVTLGRYWNLSLQAGVARTNNLGLTQIPYDPAIAAIVGPGYTTVVINPTRYVPLGAVSPGRRFERASLTFLYSRAVSPGNGVYLLSLGQTANINYSYVALKALTFSFFGGYSDLDSLGQQISAYRSLNTGAGATYKLGRSVFATFRYDYRHYNAGGLQGVGGQFQKNENRLSLGLAFSPGEKPLPIW